MNCCRNWMPRALVLLTCIYTAHSCVYFNGTDFSNQTLEIIRERETYCLLNKTMALGENVTCAGNAAMATRLNKTCVLLYTEEGENVSFVMHYGIHKNGLYADPQHAACPVPTVSTENLEEAAKTHHYGLYGTLIVVVVVIVIIIVIYVKRRKMAKDNHNELHQKKFCL